MDLSMKESGKPGMAALDAIDLDDFDWKAFCGSYRGRALITRLCHIPNYILSQPNPSPRALELARTAALRAIPIVKDTTWDHVTYLRLVNQVDLTLHPEKLRAGASTVDEPMDIDALYGKKGAESEGRPDPEWVESVRAKEEAENNRLSVELNGYLSNLIKESIRLTYLAQAELALKTGSLTDALRAFAQVREYSSGPAHNVELGLAIIQGALEFNDTSPISGNATKVDASLDRLHPPTTGGNAPMSSTMTRAQLEQSRDQAARSAEVRRAVGVKLRVARGLLGLSSQDYARAARELGEVGEEGGLQEWDGKAISTADTALLTAICALASGDRHYIRRIILDRPSFHSAVDDSQPWILEVVRAFVDAHYGQALKLLRVAEPYMLLNPFLAPHTDHLLTQIRRRAIVQYLVPFSSVRVSQMATAFETDEDEMVAEVCRLAETGDIGVRIDLVDRILHIPIKDPRASAFKTALEGGAKITAQTQANVFRMRLKEAGVIVDFWADDDKDRGQGIPGGGNKLGGSSSGSRKDWLARFKTKGPSFK